MFHIVMVQEYFALHNILTKMCFKTFFSHATYHVESNTHNEYFANANITPSWVQNCLRVREVLPQVCNYGVEHF